MVCLPKPSGLKGQIREGSLIYLSLRSNSNSRSFPSRLRFQLRRARKELQIFKHVRAQKTFYLLNARILRYNFDLIEITPSLRLQLRRTVAGRAQQEKEIRANIIKYLQLRR